MENPQATRAFELSDFIQDACRREPDLLDELQQNRPLDLAELAGLLQQQLAQCDSEQALHSCLRRMRRRVMAGIAWRDLLGLAELEQTLSELSGFAELMISETLIHLERELYTTLGVPLNSQGQVQRLYVLLMGKLGGGELNFSSDIDLIFAFGEHGQTDPKHELNPSSHTRRSVENQVFFTRLAQKLITALNQNTGDGFVYRVDMRLRPFGESGPLVMNFTAFEDYYQEQGRDWERYAMLKAKVLGGNACERQELEAMLRPFVYRRYLDFSAIDALRRMKAMISQEVRRRHLRDNIKLGAGGIRELEFVVQALQLIHGGRQRNLQQRNWHRALQALCEAGVLPLDAAKHMRDAYRFLRLSENRLQAIADQQTQTLPSASRDQQRLASCMGFADWPSYVAALEQHMQMAHEEFRHVIGEAPPEQESASVFAPLWQSQLEHDEAVALLKEQGFCQQADSAEQVWQALEQFRADFVRRSIGGRGRERINDLIPALLATLASEHPEQAAKVFERVLGVIRRILTRTTYIELLLETPEVRTQLCRLCARSSWIGKQLASYPMILDELVDPKTLYQVPSRDMLSDQLRQWMLRVPPDDLEQQMEALRQFKLAQQLRIAAADVSGILPIMQVSDQLSWLAESLLEEVVQLAWQQISERHGVPAGTSSEEPGFCILGYGKLGGIELGYGSDLDMVFMHLDNPGDTNGPRPVDGRTFYARLAQRILHLIHTRTPSGVLYETDMRLRPSGNAGMLVISCQGFAEYQQQEAWTWEHQALVRARPVAGSKSLAEQFVEVRQHILCQPREPGKLAQDVSEMRQKMRNHLSQDSESDNLFDLKQGKGGITDIEFMVQYLVLRYSAEYPALCQWSDNVRILETAAELELLTQEQSRTLIDTYCLLRDTGHRKVLQGEPNVVPAADWQAQRALVSELVKPVAG